MREIKFRLIKDNKIVGYEEHRRLDDGMGKINVFIYHSRTQHPMSWREITSCPDEYLKHDDKDQYTELKDKNGKEIYEGDIVSITADDYCSQCGHKEKRQPFISKVIHSSNTITPCVLDPAWSGWHDLGDFALHEDCEIIGNIYSNPELLENK